MFGRRGNKDMKRRNAMYLSGLALAFATWMILAARRANLTPSDVPPLAGEDPASGRHSGDTPQLRAPARRHPVVTLTLPPWLGEPRPDATIRLSTRARTAPIWEQGIGHSTREEVEVPAGSDIKLGVQTPWLTATADIGALALGESHEVDLAAELGSSVLLTAAPESHQTLLPARLRLRFESSDTDPPLYIDLGTRTSVLDHLPFLIPYLPRGVLALELEPINQPRREWRRVLTRDRPQQVISLDLPHANSSTLSIRAADKDGRAAPLVGFSVVQFPTFETLVSGVTDASGLATLRGLPREVPLYVLPRTDAGSGTFARVGPVWGSRSQPVELLVHAAPRIGVAFAGEWNHGLPVSVQVLMRGLSGTEENWQEIAAKQLPRPRSFRIPAAPGRYRIRAYQPAVGSLAESVIDVEDQSVEAILEAPMRPLIVSVEIAVDAALRASGDALYLEVRPDWMWAASTMHEVLPGRLFEFPVYSSGGSTSVKLHMRADGRGESAWSPTSTVDDQSTLRLGLAAEGLRLCRMEFDWGALPSSLPSAPAYIRIDGAADGRSDRVPVIMGQPVAEIVLREGLYSWSSHGSLVGKHHGSFVVEGLNPRVQLALAQEGAPLTELRVEIPGSSDLSAVEIEDEDGNLVEVAPLVDGTAHVTLRSGSTYALSVRSSTGLDSDAMLALAGLERARATVRAPARESDNSSILIRGIRVVLAGELRAGALLPLGRVLEVGGRGVTTAEEAMRELRAAGARLLVKNASNRSVLEVDVPAESIVLVDAIVTEP